MKDNNKTNEARYIFESDSNEIQRILITAIVKDPDDILQWENDVNLRKHAIHEAEEAQNMIEDDFIKKLQSGEEESMSKTERIKMHYTESKDAFDNILEHEVKKLIIVEDIFEVSEIINKSNSFIITLANDIEIKVKGSMEEFIEEHKHLLKW